MVTDAEGSKWFSSHLFYSLTTDLLSMDVQSSQVVSSKEGQRKVSIREIYKCDLPPWMQISWAVLLCLNCFINFPAIVRCLFVICTECQAIFSERHFRAKPANHTPAEPGSSSYFWSKMKHFTAGPGPAVASWTVVKGTRWWSLDI